jgi:integrase
LQQAVYELEDAGYAPASIRITMTMLRQAWTHGRARGWVPARDLPKVDLPQPERRTNDYTPSYDEIFLVRDAMSKPWHRTMLDALTETGARPGEVSVWRWQSYRKDNRVLLDGKTGPRWVPMTDRLQASMHAWHTMQGEPDKGPVWPCRKPNLMFRKVLRSACRRAGVPIFTPYGLRRRVSSELIDKMDVARYGAKTYSAWMGHSLQRGMQTYARVNPGRLEEAANVLGEAQGIVNLDAARRRKTGSEND